MTRLKLVISDLLVEIQNCFNENFIFTINTKLPSKLAITGIMSEYG